MEPRIDRTQFGSVTIDGKVFEHDVIIRLGGKVAKRKKRLSKAVYGTSHTISLAEARHAYQKGAVRLIIGAGQSGMVVLSDEAAAYFKRNDCQVELLPTPAVIPVWNETARRDRPAPRDVLRRLLPSSLPAIFPRPHLCRLTQASSGDSARCWAGRILR
jgi:hypothetical protein